jgi:hypothetical protein
VICLIKVKEREGFAGQVWLSEGAGQSIAENVLILDGIERG